MLIFMRKHYGHFSIFVSLPLKIAICFKALLAFIGMQMHSARKVLGLMKPRKRVTTLYVFIGRKSHLNDFNRLAKRHGIDYSFFATYDTEAYSYEQIFSIFSAHPQQNVLMGTYNPATKTIITSEEVFR